MDLANVIMGPITTEKAESQKGSKVYTLHVNMDATKVDVKNALKKYYDVEVVAVRVLRTRPKTRQTGRSMMEKRHRMKKAMITLSKKSKTLDLANFQTR